MSARRRTVRSGGLDLNVLVEGDGPAIVFLHGGGLTAHTWRRVVADLARDHRCVAVDLRGHGDSDWSPSADYTLTSMAADLRTVVAELGIARPHLVGMSLGGQVALHAVCHGFAARSLALVDVGPRLLQRPDNPIRTFMRTHSYPSFDAALDAAAEFRPDRDRASLASSLRRSMRPAGDGSWSWKWDPARRDSYAERSAEARALTGLLGAVSCPVLVVRGARSPVFGAADARRLVVALPRARLETLDAGHDVQSERPAELAALIRAFHEEDPDAPCGPPAGAGGPHGQAGQGISS
ncbi:alpha/beta hydrolase [Pseudonocardia nematodicida]|uniref:Alpha/beta hydrolase n=1 Tax=Pseudonocardia nematodicida TaxID=1206997 RepID=A0ABV1K592_9PSEU